MSSAEPPSSTSDHCWTDTGYKQTANYAVKDELYHDLKFEEYLDSDEWEFRTSTLHYNPFEDEFWFHIGFKRTKEDTDSTQPDADLPEHNTVLGIDLSVETLAVASTGRFWTGDELDHWHREFQQRRGDLQQTGTRQAHRTLQRVSKKERAYYKQYLQNEHAGRRGITAGGSPACMILSAATPSHPNWRRRRRTRRRRAKWRADDRERVSRARPQVSLTIRATFGSPVEH